MADTIAGQGVEPTTEFFLNLQVWGTPQQCLEKTKDSHVRTDYCGYTGVFSYAGMAEPVARDNLELFAREVVTELKKLGHRSLFDTAVDGAPAFAKSATKAA